MLQIFLFVMLHTLIVIINCKRVNFEVYFLVRVVDKHLNTYRKHYFQLIFAYCLSSIGTTAMIGIIFHLSSRIQVIVYPIRIVLESDVNTCKSEH